MKVNGDHRTGTDKFRNDPLRSPQGNVRFGQMILKQEERLHSEQITRLLGDISSAGDRLTRSRNLRDMAKFKMLVRRFLKETVDSGMGLKQSHTWNQYGEGSRLKIVQTIDEKLIELAEVLLDEEQTSVELLGKIGEIKGLLINLYT
ncbi:YaaR family protein [Sporosarcina highlanderae]|uniref:YaaR family protein n=1 Tax=Sporosarcina highlanderae TaxID=3035916 RepID=A0ABT8JVB4_9BACL|nr:YaaR family protein [Sporosarcina highlanderae]MDN4608877.1 YaaR family protein [Sporosarcina highlanderae]